MKKEKRKRLPAVKLLFLAAGVGGCMFAFPVRASSYGAPRGFLVNGVENQVVLSWEPVPKAKEYEIWEKAENTEGETGKWAKVKVTAKNRVVLKGKNRGNRYSYKVRAAKFSQTKKKGSFSPKRRASLAAEGKTTLWNFLGTAFAPVGSTMYIWGGGWNRADTGAGADGRRIGLNPRWRKFAEAQKSTYNYRNHRYKRGYGLDCSGFVGWTVYNTLHTKHGKEGGGYVRKSTEQARFLAGKGLGTWRPASAVKDYRPGDIMSGPGHVYIVIGQCGDGSVVLVHSSPAGVQISGTVTPSGKVSSEAVRLARTYMKKYYPSWYRRFPECSRGISYLQNYSQFRWKTGRGELMEDEDGLEKKSAANVLRTILGKP